MNMCSCQNTHVLNFRLWNTDFSLWVINWSWRSLSLSCHPTGCYFVLWAKHISLYSSKMGPPSWFCYCLWNCHSQASQVYFINFHSHGRIKVFGLAYNCKLSQPLKWLNFRNLGSKMIYVFHFQGNIFRIL